MSNKIDMPWLSHFPDDIPRTIIYDEKPLHSYLKEAAVKEPNKKALYFLGKEINYEQLYNQSTKLANFLIDSGIKKGDRVAIMLPNSPQAVISYYAVLMTGAIVVQTNPMYTHRELEYQLRDSCAKIIICLDLLYPRVLKCKHNTQLSKIIVTEIKDYLPFPKNFIYPFIQKKNYPDSRKVTESEDTFLFEKIIKKGSLNDVSVTMDVKEDLALLQYTGGTTGDPKGVMLTHYNLVSNTMMCMHWMKTEHKKETVILGILPFFHVFGMTCVMNFSIMSKSKMVILPKFDPHEVLKTIDKTQPTFFPGAPTIYISLLQCPEITKYDLSSIEACISGSAPLPIEIQEQFEKVTKGNLVEGYGLTEASPVTHANFINENVVKGSIGVPWPDTEAMIISLTTDEKADPYEVGELVIRGPQVMKGYWNREEETAAAFYKDGWLRTGDLAYMNKDGYFFIVDRKKDMIIAGGFNIYPREVEEVLYENNNVQEAVVAGIPDSYRGETVKAYVVLKEGCHVTEEELDRYCRKYLAAYKVPRMYEFRSQLPKTTVGKILRRQLVDEEVEKHKEDSKK